MLLNKELEQKANELIKQGIHFTLATVVRVESPTSSKPGAKALVTESGEIHGWIGGGCAQPAVIKTVKECIKNGQPQLIRVTPTHEAALEDGIVKFNMACHSGGTLDIFIEPISMKPQLLIIGASPVARALSKLASISGFDVTIAARNVEPTEFPDAVATLSSFKLAELNLQYMPYVVISTQGKADEAGLKAAINLGSPYTALVASQRKAEKLVEKLTSREDISQEQLQRLRYPAGVDINVRTPEEIAVALLAEIINVKNAEQPDMSASPLTSENELAEEVTTEAAEPVSGGCCSKS